MSYSTQREGERGRLEHTMAMWRQSFPLSVIRKGFDTHGKVPRSRRRHHRLLQREPVGAAHLFVFDEAGHGSAKLGRRSWGLLLDEIRVLG